MTGGATLPRAVPRPTQRHLLLATDGSANAERAAGYVADLAAHLGCRVTVAAVAVASEPPLFPWEAEIVEHPVPSDVAAGWSRRHAEQIRSAGIDVEEVVLEGHAADAIIAEAACRAVDVIVIGRRGASGIPPYPGSVADELARRCPRTLVIVP